MPILKQIAIAVALVLGGANANGQETAPGFGGDFSSTYGVAREFDRLVALLGDDVLRDMVCRISHQRFTPGRLSSALGMPEGQVLRRINTLRGWGLVRLVRRDSATTIVEPLPGEGTRTLRRWAVKYCAEGNACGEPSTTMTDYEKKRDFELTPEPRGIKRAPGKAPIFVVQQHAARRMHYDFRIEVDGVLKSWAVPRGPSLDPRQKRLAVPTEDHPLTYANFEGVIPKGQYGGGPVSVWDTGGYENITEKDGEAIPIMEALALGHARIRLHGSKLTGGFILQRTGREKDARWLLIKAKDDQANPQRDLVASEPNSVLSGRSIEEIARQEPPVKK